ncbi:tRNA (adenosine(37)-N6)-threonylcarbamoyltransferase complex ATPase subunit type 1 TsaE [Rubripirellula reticaptiva]|uniref:tRNA threonylcarbamoyladenosine biosynthesis protein TsaE n=1 Tax=Rubripirellula reticaptiva TaxID=2528013 RepID=A0A5C6EQF6_9BACT|nr:tRNA (adenosine(37)-N6)-threonylcarbamoyltransferase complex ATPase subunit type 1 TsaE [Rubripirellula reticaptiva]TWU49836.1 tRNA threonylcarbamoyladenosine biosynthesis protein TsaE [Rubripirellula reticaptiva]
MIEFQIASLEELQTFANRLAAILPTNVTIGLVGTLGAGKTSLTQAIARAIGIDSADVTSPTFTLLQSHQGTRAADSQPIKLHHLDAYRVTDDDEFIELGVEELFDEDNAWTVVEWADRVRTCLPDETLWLKLTLTSDSETRKIAAWTDDAGLTAMIGSMNR